MLLFWIVVCLMLPIKERELEISADLSAYRTYFASYNSVGNREQKIHIWVT